MSIKKYSSGSWVTVPYRKYETATDTITTLPKQIIGDGQSASAVIKGNMVQTGTPTPTSPIYPTETGDKTANLFNQNDFSLVQVTSTVSRYGTIIGVLPQGTYVFDAIKESGSQGIFLTKELNGEYIFEAISSVPFTFTADGASKYIIRTANNTGTTWADLGYTNMIVNSGSTALPYQPYGFQIPILCGGTTTNVYLGEVQSTRNIAKYEFTGEESISDIGDYYNTNVSVLSVAWSATISTTGGFQINNGGNRIWAIKSNFSSYATAADFKTYLQQQYAAGTPVTVWYVLATPTTGIVNAPIRKIGDYADSVSVSNIPTTGTAESFDIDTTLKPSEVSLTYHGWHEHSDTKF